MRTILLVVASLTTTTACLDRGVGGLQEQTGTGETIFAAGEDPDNPFFVALGSNGRTCASCHDQAAGWSITPLQLQARFDASDGLDPVFRAIDGAVAPTADVSTIDARRDAYRLLLDKGLIRVGRPIPPGAEFTLVAVDDPAAFATAAELSLYRRPLPSTNLRFAAQLMWDGREPSLTSQATAATVGHAQATAVEADAVARIVALESSIYTAQATDDVAGDLASDGARGGPRALVDQAFALGTNDPGRPGFDRRVFTLYAAWASADTTTAQGQRRAAIARGEQLFDTRTFAIRGVAGIVDQRGTCSTCHDTPNLGGHSLPVALDLGISDAGRRGAGLPLYTLRNTADGRERRTSDPGLALETGRWDDVGRFKVPTLRGLAMRPPYFHNGFADNLDQVVGFYDRRFNLALSGRDRDGGH